MFYSDLRFTWNHFWIINHLSQWNYTPDNNKNVTWFYRAAFAMQCDSVWWVVLMSAVCVQLQWRVRRMSGSAATTLSASRRDGAATAALTALICQTRSAVLRITLAPTTRVTSAASSDAAARVSAFTSRGFATRIPTVKTVRTKQTVSWASVSFIGAFFMLAASSRKHLSDISMSHLHILIMTYHGQHPMQIAVCSGWSLTKCIYYIDSVRTWHLLLKC